MLYGFNLTFPAHANTWKQLEVNLNNNTDVLAFRLVNQGCLWW